MAAMLLADWQAPVRGGEPVPPAGARRSTIPLAMKPVTRAGREPRDVAYEPIAIASRASAPVRLVGATACGAQFFVAGRWPKPRAGDARKKDPKHSTALRITQSHPNEKARAFCTVPAMAASIAWRSCDCLSPR